MKFKKKITKKILYYKYKILNKKYNFKIFPQQLSVGIYSNYWVVLNYANKNGNAKTKIKL